MCPWQPLETVLGGIKAPLGSAAAAASNAGEDDVGIPPWALGASAASTAPMPKVSKNNDQPDSWIAVTLHASFSRVLTFGWDQRDGEAVDGDEFAH